MTSEKSMAVETIKAETGKTKGKNVVTVKRTFEEC